MIKEFLRDYKPSNRMCTSLEEARTIARELELEDKDGEELLNLRNEVVDFYANMDGDIMPSLQSVTTVIDCYRYKTRFCA